MVDSVEDIPAILVTIARVPDSEWERVIKNSKRHQMRYSSGTCLICQSAYAGFISPYYDGMCCHCQSLYKSTGDNLATHRSRAKKLGLPCCLRLAEWIVNRKHFNDLCAYCQQSPYEVLDHFIPITLGGGTVANNVVPACNACNGRKLCTHPDRITKIPRVDIERVREYLSSLKIAL